MSQKTTQNATSAICIKCICINASHSEDGLQGPARPGRDWFQLAERLTAKGNAVFEDSTVHESEAGTADPKAVALALLARTIGKFEAAVLLLNNGDVVEARTMTRCATDMHTFQIGPKTGAGVSWAGAPEMQGPRLDRAPTHVAIAAAGSYLPGEPILTEEIEARIAALSPGLRLRRGLLRSLTGIETRHHLPDCMQASDLAVEAARRALDSAGASTRDIDLLVWGSASQDLVEPATAHIVAAKLGLRCPVFDVKNACNSFLNGMQVATALLRSGDYRSALVVTGESPSRAIRWVVEDLEAFFESAAGYTMGDAGAALLLTRDPKVEGIFFQKFLAASDRWSLATLPGGGSMHPRGDEWSYFRGNAVQLRDAFLQIGTGLLTAALRGTGTAMEDFARIFCHQVTRPFIAPFCATTGIPPEKLVVTVAELGNIASATIPTQIARAIEAGDVARGDQLPAPSLLIANA